MTSPLALVVDPWCVELVVVRAGSHGVAERRAISRDVERGLLVRLQRGACVDRAAFESLSPEGRHVVRMRAVAAMSPGGVVFSHWSAAVLHGLPVLRTRLTTLHMTVEHEDLRHRTGVTGHRFLVEDRELVRFGELVTTGVARTVVDVAGAAPFEEGVMIADGALSAGVPRALLEEGVALAGVRRAARRIGEVVAFAHPGAESAGESRMRCTMHRIGVEPPELQHRMVLADGSAVFLDGLFRSHRVGVELDGDRKYLEAEMAPHGAARAVIAEKRREDEVRARLAGLVRLGWTQPGSVPLLGAALARAGVRPTRPRAPFEAYAEDARRSSPRAAPRRPGWRA